MMAFISYKEGTQNVIKEALKKNLKIEIDYQNPSSLFDGYIDVKILYDDEIITEDKKQIQHSFF